MDWAQLTSPWKQFKGKGKVKDGKLTHNDVTTIAGKRDQLTARLQEKHSHERDQAGPAFGRPGPNGRGRRDDRSVATGQVPSGSGDLKNTNRGEKITCIRLLNPYNAISESERSSHPLRHQWLIEVVGRLAEGQPGCAGRLVDE